MSLPFTCFTASMVSIRASSMILNGPLITTSVGCIGVISGQFLTRDVQPVTFAAINDHFQFFHWWAAAN